MANTEQLEEKLQQLLIRADRPEAQSELLQLYALSNDDTLKNMIKPHLDAHLSWEDIRTHIAPKGTIH